MLPTTYNLSPILRGDQWNGIPRITVRMNGVPPTFPVASARMHFKIDSADEAPAAELSTEAGTIQILSAENWELAVPPQVLPLGAGKWYWDLETVDESGAPRTFLKGNLVIEQDITR